MPYVDAATIETIGEGLPKSKAAKQRSRIAGLLTERAVLGYAFSFEKLIENIRGLAPGMVEEDIVEAVKSSIIAFNEAELKAVKEEINEEILTAFNNYGVKTLRYADPFGRPKDFLKITSSSTSFSQTKAFEKLVAKGVSADLVAKVFEDSKTSREYTTLQARDVKLEEGAE